MPAEKKLFFSKQHDVDMTEGSVVRHLVMFAIPLLLGNLFQQFYNMVDTWVVGNYVSNEAFSAVGTVGPVINTLIGFFTGLANGAGVVISQYFGAKRYDKVKDAVHTSLVMTIFLCVAFTAIGVAMTPTMLHWMKQPAEVLPEGTAYLTIYFAGISGLLIYNMGSGILRAVGDSRRPFYFLVVSSVINVFLDLLLVLKFQMGVRGVAYATIIAQGFSAVLIVITLFHTDSCVRVHLPSMRLHWDMLKKVVRIGIPSAIQMSITSFSNVFIQSYINVFGADCMSGWTAYNKIDSLIILPMKSLAMAASTFVGQNLGIRNEERAKKGLQTTIWMAIGVTMVISVVIVIPTAPWLVAFFNSKAEVVEYGTLFLRWLSPLYAICCISHIFSSALRGAGNSRTPMIIMIASLVFFRQVYLFVVTNYISNTILAVVMSYPGGWLVASLLIVAYYKKVGFRRKHVVEDSELKN